MDLSNVFNQMVKGYRKIYKKEAEKEAVEIEKGGEKLIPVELPTIIDTFSIGRRKRFERIKKEIIYPLIPRIPAKNEPVFAYTKIHWREDLGTYVYELTEPPLTEKIKKIMNDIKNLLTLSASETQ